MIAIQTYELPDPVSNMHSETVFLCTDEKFIIKWVWCNMFLPHLRHIFQCAHRANKMYWMNA